MAWSDPENKSFMTTGWKLFAAGLPTAAIGYALFHASPNPIAAIMSVAGDFLVIAAIVVWIAKAIERTRKSE